MELEILKLVFDYSVKGKLADNNFIDKIATEGSGNSKE